MAILDPEHFFGQADSLIALPAAAGFEVNLRRAISAAYYGLFHCVLTAAADMAVGISNRTRPSYALAYRSVDHKTIAEISKEVLKATPSDNYKPYFPIGGFGSHVKAFATALLELQLKRLDADYDPMISVNRAEASNLKHP